MQEGANIVEENVVQEVPIVPIQEDHMMQACVTTTQTMWYRKFFMRVKT